jgi:hypothetical protein
VTATYYPERVKSEWLDSQLAWIILNFNAGQGWLCPHYLQWPDQFLLISLAHPDRAACWEHCAEAIHRPAWGVDYACDKCSSVVPFSEVVPGWFELPRAAAPGVPVWVVMVVLCERCADVEGFAY